MIKLKNNMARLPMKVIREKNNQTRKEINIEDNKKKEKKKT